MKQVQVFSVLFSVLFATGFAFSADPSPADFALKAIPQYPEIALGSTYSVDVQFSSAIEGVKGWSYGLCIDTEEQAILGAVQGEAINFIHLGNPPEYQVIKIWPDQGVTHAVILDLQGNSSLKVITEEDPMTLLNLELEPDSSATGRDISVSFCDTIGTPPVETLVVVDDQGYAPATQEEAVITVVRDPQTLLAFQKDIYNLPLNNGGLDTVVRIRSTFPLYGFSFGLQHDASLLTLDSAEFLSNLSDAIGGEEPGYLKLNLYDDGLTAAVIFDMTPPADGEDDLVYVQSDADSPSTQVLKASYLPGPAAADEVANSPSGVVNAELTFTSELGDPPVEILFQLDEEHMPSTRGCDISITETALEVSFVRGELSGDNKPNLADAILLLRYLTGTPLPFNCMEALDCNDDAVVDESGEIIEGGINLADAIYLLSYLYISGEVLGAPFPDCAPMANDSGNLGCVSFPACD